MADNDNMFEKIVELGMGMAVANQIPKMMGSVMPDASGNTQQGPPPINAACNLQLYAIIDNSQVGPLNEQEFISLIERGMINTNTMIWKPGMKNWQPAQQVPETGKMLLLHAKK